MSGTDDNWRPRGNPWVIATVVTMAAFMEVLDTTIVNVSLPHIAGSVSASYDDATWTLTSYLVANGIVLPISGSLGRVLGRKRYFLICIVCFTICSFLCGVADSLGELILFRLLQGFFGGGLQPNQQSIILDTFPAARRGAAFSVVAVATIFAPVIGPTLGGWITDTYTWRWIFFINIPVGILTTIGVYTLVEDPPWVKRDRERVVDLDWVGIALIAIGFGCLQVMMDRGEDDDWFGSPFIRLMAVGAGVGLACAVGWLLVAKRPVVSLAPLRNRNFAIGCVVVLAMYSILYASAVLIPQLAQTQLGYTALLAGLILSPGGFVTLPLIPVVSWLLPRMDTRYIIAFGFVSLGSALAYATHLTPNLSFFHLATLRLTQTFGLAFLFVPNSTISYSTLPRRLNTDASSLYVMFRNVSGSLAISLATAMITQQTQVHRAYMSRWLNPFNPNYTQLLSGMEQTLRNQGVDATALASTANGLLNQTLTGQASIMAYQDVFTLTATASFCMVPLVFLFKRSKGRRAAAPAH